MDVNVATAIFRHHEAEAFLIVEEFHFTFDHRARGSGIAAAKTVATATKPVAAAEAVTPTKAVATAKAITATAAKPVATESITAATAASAKPIAATESVAATAAPAKSVAAAETSAATTRRARIGRSGIDVVHGHDLKTAR